VVRPLQLDVSSNSSIKEAVGQLRASYDQRLDCLVNNAGINTVSWSQRGWDAEKAVNFEGPVRLAEELVPNLRPGTGSKLTWCEMLRDVSMVWERLENSLSWHWVNC
jgi:NAD(P)-dependent dehydrogenase (short-subunit alcohol dehydrogenase family)